MSKNIVATSFTLRDKEGRPPRISPLGRALFKFPGDSWFHLSAGHRVVTDLWTDKEELLEILCAHKATPEQIAVVEAKEETEGLSVADVFHLVKDDSGSTLDSVTWETGHACVELRLGEFWGNGGYASSLLGTLQYSNEGMHLGLRMASHLRLGDHLAAAQALLEVLVNPVLRTMSKDDRRAMVEALRYELDINTD